MKQAQRVFMRRKSAVAARAPTPSSSRLGTFPGEWARCRPVPSKSSATEWRLRAWLHYAEYSLEYPGTSGSVDPHKLTIYVVTHPRPWREGSRAAASRF